MNEYDLVIIGGGPAGYNAAEKAAAEGLSVLLTEKNRLGGTCLNEGCIPSKVLINSAKIYETAAEGQKYGVRSEVSGINHNAVVERKKKVVGMLVIGVTGQLSKAKVKVVNEYGIIRRKTPQGFVVSAGEEEYLGKNILISTGATALIPSIPGIKEGLESGFVITNHEMFDLPDLPKRMLIIGAGVIGIEMSTYFADAGSEVVLVEALDHVAGGMDLDIAARVKDDLEKKGVKIKLNAKVTEIGKGYVKYTDAAGSVMEEPTDVALCAIGRKPAIDNLGLEKIGVFVENGAIVTDEKMRTNVYGVYAAGDVNGKSMLASTAYREGEVAVNSILGRKDAMDYSCIPNLIYSIPEAASAGETEAQAKARGINAKTEKVSMMMSGRYLAENEGGKGFCKLVYDADKHTVIGVHMSGGCAAENIYSACLLIGSEMDIDRAKRITFPHPTNVEAIREALLKL